MDRDDLIRKLAETVADDDALLLDGWKHLVLVSRMELGTPDLIGFCYLGDGRVITVAPRDFAIFDRLEQLRDAMAEADAARTPWLAALFRIERETGRFAVDFEYERDDRWAVTPDNARDRARELAPT